MPPRTNDFQYLVELIHRLYAPHGASITQSAMVEPEGGGEPREVDVLVEHQMNLYPVRIAIEARDHSRPIDAIGVDQYIGKYNSIGGIVVDKVIIVARSFTEAARKRAKLLGFNLHTINDLEDVNLDALFVPKDDDGCWCVSKKVGNKVDVKLVDINEKKLPLNSVITTRTSNRKLGTALMWADRTLKHYIGRLANKQYKKHEGEMVCVIIELLFSNHKARIHSINHRLGKLIFNFGWRMLLPPLEAEKLELKGDSCESKTIIRESGGNNDARVNIIYEGHKESKYPSKLYLDHRLSNGSTPKGKKLIIKLDI
jgi:hypothetical protein